MLIWCSNKDSVINCVQCAMQKLGQELSRTRKWMKTKPQWPLKYPIIISEKIETNDSSVNVVCSESAPAFNVGLPCCTPGSSSSCSTSNPASCWYMRQNTECPQVLGDLSLCGRPVPCLSFCLCCFNFQINKPAQTK